MVNKVSVLLEYQSWVVDLLLHNYHGATAVRRGARDERPIDCNEIDDLIEKIEVKITDFMSDEKLP